MSGLCFVLVNHELRVERGHCVERSRFKPHVSGMLWAICEICCHESICNAVIGPVQVKWWSCRLSDRGTYRRICGLRLAQLQTSLVRVVLEGECIWVQVSKVVFCCTLLQLLFRYSCLVNWCPATHWVWLIFCLVTSPLGTAWKDTLIYRSFVHLTHTRNLRNFIYTVQVRVIMYSAFRRYFGAMHRALPWSRTWRQTSLYKTLKQERGWGKRRLEAINSCRTRNVAGANIVLHPDSRTPKKNRSPCQSVSSSDIFCSTVVEHCQEAALLIPAFKVAQCMKQNCCLGFVLHRQLCWHFFRKGFNTCMQLIARVIVSLYVQLHLSLQLYFIVVLHQPSPSYPCKFSYLVPLCHSRLRFTFPWHLFCNLI